MSNYICDILSDEPKTMVHVALPRPLLVPKDHVDYRLTQYDIFVCCLSYKTHEMANNFKAQICTSHSYTLYQGIPYKSLEIYRVIYVGLTLQSHVYP